MQSEFSKISWGDRSKALAPKIKAEIPFDNRCVWSCENAPGLHLDPASLASPCREASGAKDVTSPGRKTAQTADGADGKWGSLAGVYTGAIISFGRPLPPCFDL
jgi:hypothetical protein